MSKPYLLSVGIAFPLSGPHAHRYFDVKRKYERHIVRVVGFQITWTSYRKVVTP